MRAPSSMSIRPCSRASPPSPRSRPSRRSTASISPRSGAARSGWSPSLSSAQGRALLALLGVNGVVAAGEGPAQFEGSATGAWGAPLRLKAKISGLGTGRGRRRVCGAMGAGSQGQLKFESSQRRSRTAARSQAVGHAGAEHRSHLARLARGQQTDLRRSRQQHRRFAVARARRGRTRRREEHRRRDRSRPTGAGAGLRAGDRCGRP